VKRIFIILFRIRLKIEILWYVFRWLKINVIHHYNTFDLRLVTVKNYTCQWRHCNLSHVSTMHQRIFVFRVNCKCISQGCCNYQNWLDIGQGIYRLADQFGRNSCSRPSYQTSWGKLSHDHPDLTHIPNSFKYWIMCSSALWIFLKRRLAAISIIISSKINSWNWRYECDI
jgi:hypothetical protein